MHPSELAQVLDYTLLKPAVTAQQVRSACSEVRQLGIACLYVAPVHVVTAVRELSGAPTRVGSVAGFPLGQNTPQIKTEEAARALAQGAESIDLVINAGSLRENDDLAVLREIQSIVRVAAGATVKVILEMTLLSDDEKRRAAEVCREAGADFVQTGTGLGPGGATLADVLLLKQVCGPAMEVEAAGGIRTLEQAAAFITAGASRISTSSAIAILRAASDAGMDTSPQRREEH